MDASSITATADWQSRGMKRLRALLVLGRLSNLPTVWSNCVAGWWLGGKGDAANLGWAIAGTSLLYTGGMFLNDAFDESFDREHAKERPIPSGAIQSRTVWICGAILLAVGAGLLFGA